MARSGSNEFGIMVRNEILPTPTNSSPQPLDIKHAYQLLLPDTDTLRTNIPTLRTILQRNGYRINFTSDNSDIENLFWQELADRGQWELFKLLIENNEHHLEPKQKPRTVLTLLLERNQTALYLQILNKKFKTGKYGKEDLQEIAGHYQKYRNKFSIYLTNSMDDEFFTVFRVLLENALPSQNDLLTVYEILLLAINKQHTERNDFFKWLLENDRYRSVKKNLDPVFLKAIIGENIEQIKKIEIYDALGFTPYDYAVLSGACKITDPKYFDKKIGARKNITFWEQLWQINASRLIELIIETKHWSLLSKFTPTLLAQIPFSEKNNESLLIHLVKNKQYDLFCKILELNYDRIKSNTKRYNEFTSIITDAEHCFNIHQIIRTSTTNYPKLSRTISILIERTTSTSNTPNLDIATTALAKTPFKSLDSQFAILQYNLSLPAEDSLKEQVFFAKLAKLSAENNNWDLFKKLINTNAHHIQPTSGRKKTLFTDLAESNQWDLYFQLLDKLITDYPDVAREELTEVCNHYNQYKDKMEFDENFTFLRIALHCDMKIPDLLIYLLQKIHDEAKLKKYLIFLLQNNNFQKLDSSIQIDSILACLGISTKSFSELSELPKDTYGLRPHQYLILSGNIEPDIQKDLLPSINEAENVSLLRIALGINPTYWIEFLIKRQYWEPVKKILELGDCKIILPTKDSTSFLTALAVSGEWNLYYTFVKQHFKLLSSSEYHLRLNEILLNLLEHPDKGHEVFLLELKSQYPEPQSFYTCAATSVDNKEVAKLLVKVNDTSKLMDLASASEEHSKRNNIGNKRKRTTDSNTSNNDELEILTRKLQQIPSESIKFSPPKQVKQKSPQAEIKTQASKSSSKVEKQNTEIADADIAEVKAMLSAAFTSSLFSCDCTLSKDKSCVITLSGDKTALQLVTTFLKSKSLSKFATSLLQQPQQENQTPKFKKIITLKTKQDVQLFMAAFAKTDDNDFTELSTKLKKLTPPKEPKKQQDADASCTDKKEPRDLSIDEQNAWIKGLSSAFCKNSNFKSLIKWNEKEKCFEVDISSNYWTIKKHKARKNEYRCYEINTSDFQKNILHHITNAITASLIATTKVTDQKTLKIYPFDKTFLPVAKEIHDSIYEAFKQHATPVPLPPPPATKNSTPPNAKPTPASTSNNNNNAAPTVNVPEVLKELLRKIANLPEQNFPFLSFKQHEKHPNKWILSFSTKQVKQFDQYHSKLFFKALKATFDKHAPGFINFFGDENEYRIRINMAKMPTDFSNLSDTFAREYEKLRFERLLKILFIQSGLLTETNHAKLTVEQDKIDIHKWTIHCNNILTEAVAKALCDGLQNTSGFVTLISSNNNNNSTKLVFNTTRTPSELELKILQNSSESPTHKRIKEEIEPVSPSSAKKVARIPNEGEVYTELVRIMQRLSNGELKQLEELINLIDGLPDLKGDLSLRDTVLQFDLDLYTTRIFGLLANAEGSQKIVEAWEVRNLFRHISDEISTNDFNNVRELFPALKYLIPFAKAKTVVIKIASDKKDKVMTSLKTFLEPFREKLKTDLRQNSPERSEKYEKLAHEIEKLEPDNDITPTRKQHAILQAKSKSGENSQAPKNSKKLYPKIGHKCFGIEFGLFAANLYRKYVAPARDIQSLTL